MRVLELRKLDPSLAQATRLVGAGLVMPFTAQAMQGELTLSLLTPGNPICGESCEFSTAAGNVWLTEAGTTLSLLGEIPVVMQGEHQPWYWHFINQQLSPGITNWLGPINPLRIDEIAPEPLNWYKLEVHLGEQTGYTRLGCDTRTMLSLINRARWRTLMRPTTELLKVNTPVILGNMALPLGQLQSLRAGDVLLMSQSQFDVNGNGQMALAGRHWSLTTETRSNRLFLRIGHETELLNGQ